MSMLTGSNAEDLVAALRAIAESARTQPSGVAVVHSSLIEKAEAALKAFDKTGLEATREMLTIERARELHASEGELEIDDDAVVSRGDDHGAYVSAWVWVPDPDPDTDD